MTRPRNPVRLRAWLADQHDWLRPARPGARLSVEPAEIAALFGGWPRIYAGRDGAFHIIAPHHEPHMAFGLAVAGLVLAGCGSGAFWLWQAVHPAAGVAAGLFGLALAPLLLRLTERHLEIIVEPSGLITRRAVGGRRYLLLQDYGKPHKVVAVPHGAAKREMGARQAGQQFQAGMRNWQGSLPKGRQPPPSMPPMPAVGPRYAEATEVVILWGPNNAAAQRVAEFRADVEGRALRLQAAIEHVISLSSEERARRTETDTPRRYR